jgi:hypothetical protein
MSNTAIDAWHDFVRTKNSAAFSEALADDVRAFIPRLCIHRSWER